MVKVGETVFRESKMWIGQEVDVGARWLGKGDFVGRVGAMNNQHVRKVKL